jgi:hypothetical protein
MTTALSIVPFDDRFARRQAHKAPAEPAVVKFPWGRDTVIINGEIKPLHEGVSVTLFMPGSSGGPTRIRWHDESRYPNQGWGCLGCPYFGIDVEFRTSRYCTHPLYLELYGAPQSSNNDHADADCPMLGLRFERRIRAKRWATKSHYIFWHYYHETKRDSYNQGFTFVYPSWR